MRRVRFTERFYKIVFSIACAVIIFAGIQKDIKKEEKINNLTVASYTVETKDTLWSIATKNCPKNIDIRDYISELKEINNISSDIYENQELKILI